MEGCRLTEGTAIGGAAAWSSELPVTRGVLSEADQSGREPDLSSNSCVFGTIVPGAPQLVEPEMASQGHPPGKEVQREEGT